VAKTRQAHKHFYVRAKNIKMSDLLQPFTGARRRHVTEVFDEQADWFYMTSLAASCAQA
jgi:hypothetical protein